MELETLTPRAHRTVHLGAPEERHKVWGERHGPAIESVATAGLHRTEARKGCRSRTSEPKNAPQPPGQFPIEPAVVAVSAACAVVYPPVSLNKHAQLCIAFITPPQHWRSGSARGRKLPGSEQTKTLMVSQEMDAVLTMTTVILNVAVAVPWPTHDQPMANPRPTHGQPMANPWPVHNQPTRPSHGQPPTHGAPMADHDQPMANP